MTDTTLKRLIALCLVANSVFVAGAYAADPQKGKQLFESKACAQCHAIGAEGTGTAGPNLAGVTKKRKLSWLKHIIKSPDHMKSDSTVKELQKKYPVGMPAAGLSDQEVDDIVSYLGASDRKGGK